MPIQITVLPVLSPQLQNSLTLSRPSTYPRQQDSSLSRVKFTSAETMPAPEGRYHPYRVPTTKRPVAGQQSFPLGASQSGPSACALCLGRFRHQVHKCTSEFQWDKRTKTRCRRNAEGHLINPEGSEVCYDWQRPKGCTSTSRSHIHECSGCGSKNHGAQGCPQGENM